MTYLVPTAETTTPIDPAPAPACAAPPRVDPTVVAADWARPSGLGTTAARVASRFGRAADPEPAYVERPWGDGTAAPLYVPVLEREDDALADEVTRRLIAWGAECGFAGEQLEQLGGAQFGRLVTLAHPESDDPDLLLIAAQLNAAWWAADDLYADNSEMGAVPTELPPRLALAMAAMDPVPNAGEFTGELDEALGGDVVLVALKSATDHLARHATPAQVQRVCYATFAMFVSWNSYAAWRFTGEYPPAWKYLATRQHDTFYTSMTLIDAVGGYELDPALYYEPRVREALFQAGTAAVLVNDLHSVAKDAADPNPVCNMVLQIAADRQCSIEEATAVTVDLHNRFVRDFQDNHRVLRAVPNPALQRFLRGTRAWMGGGFEWHATNPRYKS